MSDDMILGTDAFGHSVMSGNTFYVFVDENGNRIQPRIPAGHYVVDLYKLEVRGNDLVFSLKILEALP